MTSWSVVYSDTGRISLATATAEERTAVVQFEKGLCADPHAAGEIYPDRVGGSTPRCSRWGPSRVDECALPGGRRRP